MLGPRGPRILKVWDPGDSKMGGGHFHMTPIVRQLADSSCREGVHTQYIRIYHCITI